MVIVRSLVERVDQLLPVLGQVETLPSVEDHRPSACPGCGHRARHEDGKLAIVGHGTYSRQILGLAALVVILVRRYFCRRCRRTISVLPDFTHPGRWYAAIVILEALRLYLLEGQSERVIREGFDTDDESLSWKTIRRYRRQLGWTLFGWFAARLGFEGPTQDRNDSANRLRRLMAEAIGAPLGEEARALLTNTVHFRGHVWSLGHDPPEEVVSKLLC